MRQWDVLEKIGGLDGDLIILPYEALGQGNMLGTAMTTKAIKTASHPAESTTNK